MNLEYKTKDSLGKPQVVRIEFDPPLFGYEEVKPRLLSMKADADEALGTVRKLNYRSTVRFPHTPPFPPGYLSTASALAPRHHMII